MELIEGRDDSLIRIAIATDCTRWAFRGVQLGYQMSRILESVYPRNVRPQSPYMSPFLLEFDDHKRHIILDLERMPEVLDRFDHPFGHGFCR